MQISEHSPIALGVVSNRNYNSRLNGPLPITSQAQGLPSVIIVISFIKGALIKDRTLKGRDVKTHAALPFLHWTRASAMLSPDINRLYYMRLSLSLH